MKCSDLMNMDVRTILGDSTVMEAARLMRDNSLGFLLVCQKSTTADVSPGDDVSPGALIGVVTDRDLVVRVMAEARDPSAALVSESMSQPVVTCVDTEDLGAAEKRMGETQKRRLVVVDAGGAPVGVLSLTDVMMGDRPRRAAQTARGILSREASGPHTPIENIELTASTVEDEEKASEQTSVTIGSHHSGSMKEFP